MNKHQRLNELTLEIDSLYSEISLKNATPPQRPTIAIREAYEQDLARLRRLITFKREQVKELLRYD